MQPNLEICNSVSFAGLQTEIPAHKPTLEPCSALFVAPEMRTALQELDEGARRRMPKLLYIPLPCALARAQMLERRLSALFHCHRPFCRTLQHLRSLTAALQHCWLLCLPFATVVRQIAEAQ